MWWIHMNPVLTCIKHCLSYCIFMTMFIFGRKLMPKSHENYHFGASNIFRCSISGIKKAPLRPKQSSGSGPFSLDLRPFPRSYGWNMGLFVGFTVPWVYPTKMVISMGWKTRSSSPVPPGPLGQVRRSILGWYWWYWNDISRWFIYMYIYM